MIFVEILIIVFAISVVLFVVGSYIYKVVKKLPTGECCSCKKPKKMKMIVANARKELDNERNCNSCSCK